MTDPSNHLPVRRCRWRRCRFRTPDSRFLMERESRTSVSLSLAFLNVCTRCGYAFIDSPHPNDLRAFFADAEFARQGRHPTMRETNDQ